MTSKTAVAVATVLLFTVAADAQESKELVRPIDADRALRLEQYNSAFLRQELFHAARHRIVEVNADLLLDAQDITVTPFEDVEPFQLAPLPGTPRRVGDDHIFWSGQYKQLEALNEALGAPVVSVTIAANAWDLEPSGDAVVSSQNRFEFSPLWVVNENGNVVLDRSRAPPGQLVIPGDPPRTPEQIAKHRRIQNLNKHAFYSVDAVFDAAGGSRYVLKALKYTPRYSVLYEIRRDTVMPVKIDRMPGDPEATPEERAAFDRYRRLVESLPNESDKSIRGEIP
jgi:hypothetical protein